jgi:hypothetical protein
MLTCSKKYIAQKDNCELNEANTKDQYWTQSWASSI